MTQGSVTSASFDRHGRGWIILLQATPSDAASQLVHPSSGKRLGKHVGYVPLGDLAAQTGSVAKPAMDLLLKPIDQRLDVVLRTKGKISTELGKKQKLLLDLRGYAQDVLHPLMRTLWQQGFSEKTISPEMSTAHVLDAPQSSRRVLSYDERMCLAAMRKAYGEWFWPNITGLCFLVMAKTVIGDVLEDPLLDGCLKSLTQVLLHDGNIPLGLTAEGKLLVLAG